MPDTTGTAEVEAPMSEERLNDIEGRAEKATSGPWDICLGSGRNVCTGINYVDLDGGVTFVADCLPDYAIMAKVDPDDHRPTMDFIAHARTDVPALIAEVRRQAKQIRDLQTSLNVYEGERHTLYRRVDLSEPCQYVGIHPVSWGKADQPTAAFVAVEG